MAKLTLSVDSRVVLHAKRFAKKRGVSISKMVETYLATVIEPANPVSADTPILRSVRGTLRNADIGDYKKHLAAKYR